MLKMINDPRLFHTLIKGLGTGTSMLRVSVHGLTVSDGDELELK